MKRGNQGQRKLDGFDAFEHALYGDVENDADLEAELLALQGEIADEEDDPDENAAAAAASNRRSIPKTETARNNRRSVGQPGKAQKEPFEDFDKLARQISAEVVVEDDQNDASVDDDEDLLAELSRVMGGSTDAGLPSAPPRAKTIAATSLPSLPPPLTPTVATPTTPTETAKISPIPAKKDVENVPVVSNEPKNPENFDSTPATPAPSSSTTVAKNNPVPALTLAPAPAVAISSSSSTPTFSRAAVLEALQQRMEKYKTTAAKAVEDGDDSKQRRMTRIQKQYEQAIREYKANKPVNFDDLPVPPGFPPLPLPPKANTPKMEEASSSSTAPIPTARPAPEAPRPVKSVGSVTPVSGHVTPLGPARQSRQEQQLNFLLERQRQFKSAALDAKKRGDLAAAKDYLRQALGFNQMIEASRSGLPVDIKNAPTPPQAKTAPQILRPTVATSKAASDLALDKIYGRNVEGSALVRGNREETYASLEADLIRQVQLCDQNRDYFTKFGDVAKVSLFEKMGSICKKELDSLRNGFRHGDPVPRFHYESRTFPVLHCCPDLGVDDLEIQVIRGLMLKLPAGYEPKDADIFVKYDFPYPKETPQTGRTLNVRGTNCPTFSHNVKLKVNMKSRQFLLAFKRKGVKFEVYQKGSLFRSDKLLGTAEVKLLPLENKAEIHESVDLLEGRKPVGGKLEVKIRIREPILHKTIEEAKEKWLTIDEFIRIPKGVITKNRLPELE